MWSRKLLVVEDAPGLRKAVERMFLKSGFSVITAANGSDALLLAQEARPDLVLADAALPGLDGHSLCRVLKRGAGTSSIPVVLMSGARIGEVDVVGGLEGGADDYILKPFLMRILLARIRAVLRRHDRRPRAPERLKGGGIELDPASREVRVSGREVSLTRKEFELLAMLLHNPGKVLAARHLLEWIWGYDPADYNDSHTVEEHISRLRRKLGPKASRHIANLRGSGYKFKG